MKKKMLCARRTPRVSHGVLLVVCIAVQGSAGLAVAHSPDTGTNFINGDQEVAQKLQISDEVTDSSSTAQSSTESAAPPVDPYERFNKYMTKGFNLQMPGPSNYIDPDVGGIRSAMADKGFGYWGYSMNSYNYDLRNRGHTDRDGSQIYSGQKPTYSTYNYLYLTYDLSRYGIENGQLSASAILVYSSWDPAGPSKASIGVVQYYQTLFHGKVELTVGNLADDFTYTGIYVGGNTAAGSFGLSANLPSETGQSNTLEPRPGITVKVNLGEGFYDRFGVQRSINPDGGVAEKKANPSGLTWRGKGVGTLFVNELGYRRDAAPGSPDTWVRGGYSHNSSDYSSYKNPGETGSNHTAYILVDRQIYQLGDKPWDAYRGIYVGFSDMYAPPSVNEFSKYYELRVYAKGLFASRPADMISLVGAQNVFSKYAVNAARAEGLPAVRESTSVALSYSANVVRGVFVTGGFSYINHPRPVVTTTTQDPGLNFTLAAQIFY